MSTTLISELQRAARFGRLERVKVLLAAGIRSSEDKIEALRLAFAFRHQDVAFVLVTSGTPLTKYALYEAVVEGWANVVRALLDAGADLHYRNDIALYCAVIYKQLEIVKILLAAGANFRVENYKIIQHAVGFSKLDIVEALVSYCTAKELTDIQSKMRSSLLAEIIARHKPRGSRTKAALREPRPAEPDI